MTMLNGLEDSGSIAYKDLVQVFYKITPVTHYEVDAQVYVKDGDDFKLRLRTKQESDTREKAAAIVYAEYQRQLERMYVEEVN